MQFQCECCGVLTGETLDGVGLTCHHAAFRGGCHAERKSTKTGEVTNKHSADDHHFVCKVVFICDPLVALHPPRHTMWTDTTAINTAKRSPAATDAKTADEAKTVEQQHEARATHHRQAAQDTAALHAALAASEADAQRLFSTLQHVAVAEWPSNEFSIKEVDLALDRALVQLTDDAPQVLGLVSMAGDSRNPEYFSYTRAAVLCASSVRLLSEALREVMRPRGGTGDGDDGDTTTAAGGTGEADEDATMPAEAYLVAREQYLSLRARPGDSLRGRWARVVAGSLLHMFRSRRTSVFLSRRSQLSTAVTYWEECTASAALTWHAFIPVMALCAVARGLYARCVAESGGGGGAPARKTTTAGSRRRDGESLVLFDGVAGVAGVEAAATKLVEAAVTALQDVLVARVAGSAIDKIESSMRSRESH